MKRIYKGNDLIFNITVDDIPINLNVVDSINFKFYTKNIANCIPKSKADVNSENQLILEWLELSQLEEGVLFYEYDIKMKDSSMSDGYRNKVVKEMTDYYIVTGSSNIDIDGELSNYYTKEQANDIFQVKGNYLTEVDIDKKHFVTEAELNLKGFLTEVPEEYVTESELSQKGYLTTIPEEYVTDTELTQKGYLTEIPAEYVTDDELTLKNYATKSDIPSLTGYAKEEWVKDEIANAQIGGEVDLSGYAKESWVKSQGYLTEVPAEYVTDTELNQKNYATKSELPSLNGYAKEEWVNSQGFLKEIPTEYVTDTELTQKNYATKSEIPSLNGYAKESWVTEEIAKAQIGGGDVDLTGYAKEEWVNSQGFLKEVPAEYVTETELGQKGYLTEIPEEYVTDSELTQKGYLTEQSLGNYYKKTETYSQEEVNGKLATKAEKSELEAKANSSDLLTKQDKLESGVNIATINGQSLLEGKDITIEGGAGNLTVNNISPIDGNISLTANEIPVGEAQTVSSELTRLDSEKQASLVSGQNIATINGQTLLEAKDIKTVGKAVKSGEIFNDYAENSAFGVHSHAEGLGTHADGKYSHSEGTGTSAKAEASHAEGKGTYIDSSASYSHVEGLNTKAYDQASHAEGESAKAYKKCSHAEGYLTEAGSDLVTGSDYSHAEGLMTKAHAEASHAQGVCTIAENYFQTSLGKYNVKEPNPSPLDFDPTKTIVSVGNGTREESRSDALRILGNGNLYIQGLGGFTGVETNGTETIKSLQQVIGDIEAAISGVNASITNITDKIGG